MIRAAKLAAGVFAEGIWVSLLLLIVLLCATCAVLDGVAESRAQRRRAKLEV